ncbi:MAG: ATP-binding cassette domain-containing protein, partial [Actinomycetota bacterium]|nr:ATP-binding cassette domain-containing protein [Actinomycetota bacterium]
EARLTRAIQLVGLSHTVQGLPNGLATVVGEGGVSLSAGERQRVALARAVVRDAPIVLLDEPVAHLDAHTEAALRDTLGPWLESRTVLVAAHRPELVARLDRVGTRYVEHETVRAGDLEQLTDDVAGAKHQ